MNKLTDYTVKELAKELNAYIAKDMDEQWYAFNKEPARGDVRWTNDDGFISLDLFDFGDDDKVDWKDSLVSPPLDWSKVAVDTPVMVRCSKDKTKGLRYFAMFLPRSNEVLTFNNGTTSKTAISVSNWERFRLATPKEIEQSRSDK